MNRKVLGVGGFALRQEGVRHFSPRKMGICNLGRKIEDQYAVSDTENRKYEESPASCKPCLYIGL